MSVLCQTESGRCLMGATQCPMDSGRCLMGASQFLMDKGRYLMGVSQCQMEKSPCQKMKSSMMLGLTMLLLDLSDL